VRGRHASHITVVLSKAAHSGPSVYLRARDPCPLRVSCPGADRAERAVRAPGVSVQCELQVLALPRLLGSRHNAAGATAGLHAYSVDADSQSLIHRWTEISQFVIMFQLFGSIEVIRSTPARGHILLQDRTVYFRKSSI
jgi:hypothetical protein